MNIYTKNQRICEMKKSGSKIVRSDLKKEIIDNAKEGVFDPNPLLATIHNIRCKACGFTQKITYLDHLKSGQFEFGETQTIEVSYAAPTLSGLSYTTEKRTPLIITVGCEKCGNAMQCSPVSLEYLLFTISRQHKLKSMYV